MGASQGRAGGGVGILGVGSTGAAGVYVQSGGYDYPQEGEPGSGGVNNGVYNGGTYGGGGASGVKISGNNYNGDESGKGVIRIMWPGNERSYPSTRTADE
mgnify:FL=1